MSSAGGFEINIYGDGYPVFCHIVYCGDIVARVTHSELSDLKYVVEKAMAQARQALPDRHKEEV